MNSGSSSVPTNEKKGFIRRFVPRTVRHALSFSCAGFASSSGDDDLDPLALDETSSEISLKVGAKAVPIAHQRLAEILNNTRFIKRRNRMCAIPSFKVDAFKVGLLVGRGGFANVHKLEAWCCDCELNEDENAGNEYVIKTLRVERATTPQRLAVVAADLMMEAHILSTLEHPHILALRGISTNGLSSLKRGRVDGLFLILDYLPVTLTDRLEEWKNSQVAVDKGLQQSDMTPCNHSLSEQFQVAIDLASSLAYLHQKNIIYRDLKPSNVGFDHTSVLKLFDFGMAVEVPRTSDPNKTFQLTGRKGTPRYLSPECIKKKPYNAKTDVFGMAILTWQLLTLCKPFQNHGTLDTVMQRVLDGDRPLLKYLPAYLKRSTRAKLHHLLASGWSKEIADRPTMQEMHSNILEIAQGELGLDAVRTEDANQHRSNTRSVLCGDS